MTDPNRIQGPSGPPESNVPKKEKVIGPNDFRKYMVEEVSQIDPEQRGRKRKRREEGEEDTDAEKQAIGVGPQVPHVAPIEKDEEAPLAVKGRASLSLPSSSRTDSPTTTTPTFNPQDIEQFAWEDEAKRTVSQFSAATPSSSSQTSPPAAKEATATPSSSPQTSSPAEEEAPTPPQYQQYTQQSSSQNTYDQGSNWEGYTRPSLQQPNTPSSSQNLSVESQPKKHSKKKVHTIASQEKKVPAPKKEAKKTELLAKEGKRSKGGLEGFKNLMEEPKVPKKKKQPVRLEKKEPETAAPKRSEKKEPETAALKQPEKKELETTTSKRMATPSETGASFPSSAGLADRPVRTQPEEETVAPLGTLPSTKKGEAGKLPSKKIEEQREDEESVQGIPAGLPMGQTQTPQGETGREGKSRDDRHFAPSATPTLPMEEPLMSMAPIAGEPASMASVSPYAELHPEILSLFERMVGVLTVMKTAGITETTLILSEKAFAGTALSGASIKISEFRFAAGELNLEFSGSPQAIGLLQQHLPSLTTALSRAGLVVKRTDFIFSRKEALKERDGEGEKEQKRGNSR